MSGLFRLCWSILKEQLLLIAFPSKQRGDGQKSEEGVAASTHNAIFPATRLHLFYYILSNSIQNLHV